MSPSAKKGSSTPNTSSKAFLIWQSSRPTEPYVTPVYTLGIPARTLLGKSKLYSKSSTLRTISKYFRSKLLTYRTTVALRQRGISDRREDRPLSS